MKILYVVTQGEMGGAQKYVLDLAFHFKGSVAAGNESGLLLGHAKALGLPTYSLRHLRRSINPVSDILAAWELRHLIIKLKPDIVHLNSSKAGIVGSMACWGLGTKVVFTAHGFVFNEPLRAPVQRTYLMLEKFASLFRDHIIAVSKADRKSALDNNVVNEKKITVVHHGIEPIEFLDRDLAHAKLGLPADKLIIGTIANFYRTKGLDVLINAIALLPKHVLEKIHVVMIGEGSELENLKLEIRNYGLKETVSLPGSIPNASRLLKAFDIFVLPSRKEGFPYTLLEALQASLPIIASNVGGNAEAIGDAGITIPSENPEALSRAITELAGNKNLQTRLADKALTQAKLFTMESMVQRTNSVYEAVLGTTKL